MDNMHEELPRGYQHFDHFEYNEGASSKLKRHYHYDEDNEDRVSKKWRDGRDIDLEYLHGVYSDSDFVEAKARYTHERHCPRDPHDEGIEQSGSRQGIDHAQSMGFDSPAGTRLVAREELVASVAHPSASPSLQKGRLRMSYAEAIAAAIEQKREAQSKAEEEHRQKIMAAAQEHPHIQQLVDEGRFDELDELLEVASALQHMGNTP
jgi:hypothetical protein